MRKIFFRECLKRMDSKDSEGNDSYTHLTNEERIMIEILYTAGFKQNFIAIFLGRSRSTIGRELGKNVNEYWDMNITKSPYKHKGQENVKYYLSEQAQKKYEENRKKCRKKTKLENSPILLGSIIALLRDKAVDYSPEIKANFSKQGKIKGAETSVCANTIYSAIYQGIGGLKIKDMPHKIRYYKKPKNKHTETKAVPERKKDLSIEKMPEGAKTSETYFKGDSVVGVRTSKYNTLITLVNKFSQFTFIERSENKNRLIRRSFIKGKLDETLTDEDILNIARKINNMPRKALGYRTPLEVFEESLKKRNIDTKFLNKYRIELPKCLVA